MLSPVAAQAVAAPTAPYTAVALSLQPDAPSSWMRAENLSFDDSNSRIQGPGDTASFEVTALKMSTSQSATVKVIPPTGHVLTEGSLALAAVADATHAQVVITPDFVFPAVDNGTVTVNHLVSSANGDVTSASITIAGSGEGAHMFAEVRYNSSQSYAAPTISDLFFPDMTLGQTSTPMTWTFGNSGPTPLVVSSATLMGVDPDEFIESNDTCSGTTLHYQETCTVDVAAKPFFSGDREALLVFQDNSSEIQDVARLQVQVANSVLGSYGPTAVHRIVDTRIGRGVPKTKIGPGGSVTFSSGFKAASAVVLNVTVTHETARSGYITAYAAGTVRPTASNLNYVKGVTRAANVTVPTSSTGAVTLFNSSGSVDLIVDIEGSYSATAVNAQITNAYDYFPDHPWRLLDTRDKANWSYGALPSGYYATLPINLGTDWQRRTGAFVVNITAVSPKASGYLSAYISPEIPTETSTVNFQAGVTTANLAIVQSGTCERAACKGTPTIRVFNGSKKATHVVVDVIGWYGARSLYEGFRFTPLTPTRIVDTRTGLGASTFAADQTQTIAAPSSVAGYDTWALATNVTAVAPPASTYLTLWQHGSAGAPPTVSSLNARAGVTVANATPVELGSGDLFDVYNHAGATDVVVDVSGRFDLFPTDDPPHLVGTQVARAAAVTASSPVRRLRDAAANIERTRARNATAAAYEQS